jgi:hypothetical protein
MAERAAGERATGWTSAASFRSVLEQANHLLAETQNPCVQPYQEEQYGVWMPLNVPGSVFEKWREQARRFLGREERWREIQTLKRALLDQGKLEGHTSPFCRVWILCQTGRV